MLSPELSPDLSDMSSDLCLCQNLTPFRCLTPKTPSLEPLTLATSRRRELWPLLAIHAMGNTTASPPFQPEKPGQGKSVLLPKKLSWQLVGTFLPLLLACPQTCSQYVSLRSFFPQHKHLTRFCFPEAALLLRCTEGLRYVTRIL